MYTYYDAYLSDLVTQGHEDRALADVDAIATFSAEWREKLAVLRAYILACLESMAAPDDLFTAKLGQYRKEWTETLAKARAATTDSDGNRVPVLVIPWERG